MEFTGWHCLDFGRNRTAYAKICQAATNQTASKGHILFKTQILGTMLKQSSQFEIHTLGA